MQEVILHWNLLEEQKKRVYKEEAELLNVALFGMTSFEWKKANPNLAKKGNIRDYADLVYLIILNNLENINSELIMIGMSQYDRLVRLNNIARQQLKIIKDKKIYKESFENKKETIKPLQ